MDNKRLANIEFLQAFYFTVTIINKLVTPTGLISKNNLQYFKKNCLCQQLQFYIFLNYVLAKYD